MTAVMNNQNQIESVTTSAYARISKPVPKSSVWKPITVVQNKSSLLLKLIFINPQKLQLYTMSNKTDFFTKCQAARLRLRDLES